MEESTSEQGIDTDRGRGRVMVATYSVMLAHTPISNGQHTPGVGTFVPDEGMGSRTWCRSCADVKVLRMHGMLATKASGFALGGFQVLARKSFSREASVS